MSDYILINQLDILCILAAFCIAWISQTKAAAITAAEFFMYGLVMNLYMIFDVTSPFQFIPLALICWFSCNLHIICTSHRLIVTSFFIPMLYNLGMFYDWGCAQWVINGEYGFFDKYHTSAMSLVVAMQLIVTSIHGGLIDGFRRWVDNARDDNTPYLRTAQGSPK